MLKKSPDKFFMFQCHNLLLVIPIVFVIEANCIFRYLYNPMGVTTKIFNQIVWIIKWFFTINDPFLSTYSAKKTIPTVFAIN